MPENLEGMSLFLFQSSDVFFLSFSPVFDLHVLREYLLFLLTAVLFSGCTSLSHDSPHAEIRSLFLHKNYGNLFVLSRENALRGDPESEFVQGYLREYGLGTSPDLGKAVFWYKKSAVNENKDAMNDLALLYLIFRTSKKHRSEFF